MKCRICSSDETYWVETVMLNEMEGYETYGCKSCNGRQELGIRVTELVYTGYDNFFPYEKE